MEVFLHTFKHALIITSFILGMMLLVEYFTVQTKYKFIEKISANKWLQVLLAAVLGIIPGCLGTFFAVTLYVHGVFNFAALTTTMIATSGDEAYAILAMIPEQFVTINVILFVVAIITGFLINLFIKKQSFVRLQINHLQYHGIEQNCYCFDKREFVEHWRKLTFQRAILVTVLAILVIFQATGQLGPKQPYFRYTLLLMFLFGLFVVVTVPEHFLNEHIWEHTVKKHLPKIFLWTFAVLLFVDAILPLLDITPEKMKVIGSKYFWLLLLIAVVIGIIPESGPHLVFVILFAKGLLPLSILIANSISQDGHGSLPLLAESKKSFLLMKLINIFVGIIVGAGMHLLGF